jgi:hypothetical protein
MQRLRAEALAEQQARGTLTLRRGAPAVERLEVARVVRADAAAHQPVPGSITPACRWTTSTPTW